jgi:hypothetical protein
VHTRPSVCICNALTADAVVCTSSPPLRTPQAVSSAHAALRPLLYTNVILTGGLCACPGFSDRFQSELRPLVPDTFDLGTPLDVTRTWHTHMHTERDTEKL